MLGVCATLIAGCAAVPGPPATVAPGPDTRAEQVVIASPAGLKRPPFAFAREDEALLESVQRGAFNWMMAKGIGPYGFVPDRSSEKVISTAGVGFQLAGLCVAAERGWLDRAEAERRAAGMLRTLRESPGIRKAGLYQHFVDLSADGRVLTLHGGDNLEHVVSTIDSTLLLCGAIVAGEYFGGETARLATAMVGDVDWTFFQAPATAKAWEAGRISLGWRLKSAKDPEGPGTVLPYLWLDSGCEHRLVTFLASGAPDAKRAVSPGIYYALRRQIGAYPGVEPMAWFPYSGAIFVNQFSHVFVNYAAMGPDDPAAKGVANRARVDWWENSRRVTNLHRRKAVENPLGLPGFGSEAWGLTASDKMLGYQVAGVFPVRVPLKGETAEVDYSTYVPTDQWGDGTIAPYGAGMSILFEPEAAMAALWNYRRLADGPRLAGLWTDPAKGGFGFADAFNPGTTWVASDHLAIDQLPLMLAIENARTGFVWKWFHRSATVRTAMERLGLKMGKQAD